MRRTKTYATYGTIFLIVSALLTAGSNVYYSNKVQEISPFTFTFISFFITGLFFHGIQLRNYPKNIRIGKKNFKDIIGINLSTAGVFMSFYFALKYIEPAIVGAIEIGVGPISFLIINKVLYRKGVNRIDLFTGVGALIGSLFLILATLQGNSGLVFESIPLAAIGLVSATLCGFFAALAAIYSKKLSVAQWNSTKILAHRFYAIIVLSLIFSLVQGNLPGQLTSNWIWILIVSMIGVAIPLYFLQIGIQHSETFFVMMSLSFIPIFTFAFQFFDPRIATSYHSLSGISIILVFALFSVYVNNSRNKSIAKNKEMAI
ncbi:DMT family transporter [Pseudalkalibacillus salsuginis]|uniref:DMT family transporter n=1 Tax=Pseudalkalibacillus salsuginis TaxID=2910972 RepID=UPI001F15AB8C|nr:DMT family transporter [Pseudalkalibacillus salsuginis]MCF6410068.1 DMT family transporter [Pseudalkalibacillus salsuginis]